MMSEDGGKLQSKLSENERDEIKRERLQYTVEYAYEHSPFYRELMDDHGVEPADIQTFEDLQKIPVVTSDDIRRNQPPESNKFLFRATDVNMRRVYHTSGSTGEQKKLFHSHDDQNRMIQRGTTMYDDYEMTSSDVVVNYFPFAGLNISGYGNEIALDQLGAETVPIGNTPYPPEKEAELLQTYQPDILLGLPSHIDVRGRQFQQAGIKPDDLGIRMIIVAGEPISEQRKKHIEDVFDATVLEFFGCTEFDFAAWECPEHNILHNPDLFHHIEIVDDNGNAVPEGEEGRLVMTHLLSPDEESGMPLIRYAIGDLAVKRTYHDSCECQVVSWTELEPIHALATLAGNRGSISFFI